MKEDKIINPYWFIQAISYGDIRKIKDLIERGCNVNEISNQGILDTTPLVSAIKENNEEIVELLLEKGADPNLAPIRGYPPLRCVRNPAGLYIANMLIEAGAEINTVEGAEGYTALHSWCEKGFTEGVKLLIERGANINTFNGQGKSPLTSAAYHSKGYVVELLLENGVDIDSQDKNGDTALIASCESDESWELVKRLLALGADVNIRNNIGQTALRKAVDGSIFRPNAYALLRAGADPDIVDMEGNTIMSLAYKRGYKDLIKYMLKNHPSANGAYSGIGRRL